MVCLDNLIKEHKENILQLIKCNGVETLISFMSDEEEGKRIYWMIKY